MFSKDNKLYSVFTGTCPRCHEGKIFKYWPYRSLDFARMNKRCSNCGQLFEPEPDFYQGAMYVSYGLSTGIALSLGVVLMFVLELNIWLSTVILTVILMILLPILFRVSRVIWLNFFVRYRPQQSGLQQ